MKIIKLLMGCMFFSLFTMSYSMKKENSQPEISFEKNPEKYLLNNKGKIITITPEEASHSSLINVLNEEVHYNTEFIFKKKDIERFQKVLHQPGMYETFKRKKIYKTASIAEKFKAPLLYAEIINAHFPPHIVQSIAQKYIDLHNLTDALFDKTCHSEMVKYYLKHKKELYFKSKDLSEKDLEDAYMRKEEILQKYIQWSNELKLKLDHFMPKATLLQTVLLSLSCNARKFSYITIKLIPSMPGFNAIASLPQDNQNLLSEFLSANLEYKKPPRHNKYTLIKFEFMA